MSEGSWNERVTSPNEEERGEEEDRPNLSFVKRGSWHFATYSS